MTKKKKSKTEEKENKQYSIELVGLLLVLIGILGFGFGIVGAFIKKFAMFLVGEWWPIILAFLIFVGFYMIIGRKKPKFFSSKYIGFYIILIVILVLSHYTFIQDHNTLKAVIDATKENYMARIATVSGTGPILSSGQGSISVGGGFIGAFFAGLFVQLFSLIGTIIVISVMAIVGTILLFNINLSELIDSIKEFMANHKLVSDDEDDEGNEDESNEEEDFQTPVPDNKVVITSVEDLKNHPINSPQAEVQSIPEPVVMQSDHPYKLPAITLLDNPKHASTAIF